jgi:nicotinate-nucleotide pyrophosphorylase (carboxylating)
MIPERRTDLASLAAAGFTGAAADEGVHFPLSREETRRVVRAALEEDDAFNDITTLATVLSDRRAHATLVARAAGVVAGGALACEAFRQLDPAVDIRTEAPDGSTLAPGTPILSLNGHVRAILSAERVALNFMQHLSGVATLTARFVNAVSSTQTRILDTRKTTPGLRQLEKYAVRCGGGTNHRADLASAVLIKDNHLAAVDGNIEVAVRRARSLAPVGTRVEVECDTIEQVRAALVARADIIMLDNMDVSAIQDCVEEIAGRAIVEASGGINLERVRLVAATGVDWISIGALTHSAPALDLALDIA